MKPSDAPLVSIVIPYFNRWDLTHPRLMELYQYAPDTCEIILVDDASTEPEPGNGANWWMKSSFIRHRIRYYRNPENLGFGKSLNNGAKLARGKYIVLLSNDVVVQGDFITDIITLINQDDKMLVCGRAIDWAGGWNEFRIEGKHYVIPYAEGWLLACTKTAWKSLGGFDPVYGKYDYEDVDISTKALELGFSIVPLNSQKVHHLGSQTITPIDPHRRELTDKNRQIYMSKWLEKIPAIMEKTNGN